MEKNVHNAFKILGISSLMDFNLLIVFHYVKQLIYICFIFMITLTLILELTIILDNINSNINIFFILFWSKIAYFSGFVLNFFFHFDKMNHIIKKKNLTFLEKIIVIYFFLQVEFIALFSHGVSGIILIMLLTTSYYLNSIHFSGIVWGFYMDLLVYSIIVFILAKLRFSRSIIDITLGNEYVSSKGINSWPTQLFRIFVMPMVVPVTYGLHTGAQHLVNSNNAFLYKRSCDNAGIEPDPETLRAIVNTVSPITKAVNGLESIMSSTTKALIKKLG